jgi:hypothetical protein
MVEKLSRWFTDTKFNDPYYKHYIRDVTPVSGGEPLLYDEDDVFRGMINAVEECTRRNIEAGTPQSRHNKIWRSVNMKKKKKCLKYYKDRYEE